MKRNKIIFLFVFIIFSWLYSQDLRGFKWNNYKPQLIDSFDEFENIRTISAPIIDSGGEILEMTTIKEWSSVVPGLRDFSLRFLINEKTNQQISDIAIKLGSTEPIKLNVEKVKILIDGNVSEYIPYYDKDITSKNVYNYFKYINIEVPIYIFDSITNYSNIQLRIMTKDGFYNDYKVKGYGIMNLQNFLRYISKYRN